MRGRPARLEPTAGGYAAQQSAAGLDSLGEFADSSVPSSTGDLVAHSDDKGYGPVDEVE